MTHEIFFIADPAERARALYDAYVEHPSLSKRVAHEDDGASFSDVVPAEVKSFRNVMYNGSPLIVQAVFYLEPRARIAIIQAAGELVVAGRDSSAKDQEIDLGVLDTPGTFQQGMTWMAGLENPGVAAAFWQHLVLGWGGFLLRAQDDVGAIAERVGVANADVQHMLDAYAKFFPATGGWWFDIGDDVTRLKMMPRAFVGLGAHRRRLRYGWNTYNDFEGSMKAKFALAAWNNYSVDLLSH